MDGISEMTSTTLGAREVVALPATLGPEIKISACNRSKSHPCTVRRKLLVINPTPIMTLTATIRAVIAIEVRLSERMMSRAAMLPINPKLPFKMGLIIFIKISVISGDKRAKPIKTANTPPKATTKCQLGIRRRKPKTSVDKPIRLTHGRIRLIFSSVSLRRKAVSGGTLVASYAGAMAEMPKRG